MVGFDETDLKTGGQTLQCLPLPLDMVNNDTSLETGGGRLTLASFNYPSSQQIFGEDSVNRRLIKCALCDTIATDTVRKLD